MLLLEVSCLIGMHMLLADRRRTKQRQGLGIIIDHALDQVDDCTITRE
jgi:hypothetical protein